MSDRSTRRDSRFLVALMRLLQPAATTATARKLRRTIAGTAGLGLVAASAVAFGPFTGVAAASTVTSIPSSYFTVVDTGGVNDENGGSQLELTQMGRDDTDPSAYKIFWSWDSTDFTSQTGDACALFDSDGDGNVNFDVCGEVENGSNGTVVQTSISPNAQSCDDAWNDRCGTPKTKTPSAGDLTAGPIDGGPSTGDLVTATDPFAGQTGALNSPNDTTLAMTIAKSFLPLGSQLVNVCSYESIANGGNNNPNDCIVNPGGGFLTIVKDTTGGDGTFPFTVDSTGGSSLAKSITTTSGTGHTDPISLVIGGGYATAETVPSGWLLTSASCHLEDGTSTGTFSAANNKVSDIAIQSGRDTTCTFNDAKAAPALTLKKSTTTATYSAVGDTISYSYVAKNTGNVPLTPPYSVDDNKTSVTCDQTPDPLPVNGTFTCTATYAVTQADIDAGSVTNLATAHATYNGDDVASNQDSVTVDATHNPQLTLDKTSPDTSYNVVGEVLLYNYKLTNSGNVTLSEPYAVSDDKSTDVTCPAVPATLAPGDSVNCTGTYSVTQADLDNASVTNHATATAHELTSTGAKVTSNEDQVTIPAAQGPALGLDKAPTEASYSKVGDVLHYTYTLTNTGNVTLTKPFAVSDDKISNVDCSNAVSSLAVGAMTSCTATYTVTQADIDAGSVTNHATATATFDGDLIKSNEAHATVPAVQSPALGLAKTAAEGSYSAVGDVLHYTYALTNLGNVTLSAPYAVTDDKVATVDCPTTPATLAPGASVQCTASYTVTQADIDAGSVTNHATATAVFGTATVTSNEDDVTVPAVQAPGLTLVKSVDKSTASYGDTLTYTLKVTNAGNTDLTGVVVSDVVPKGTTYVPGSATPNASFDSAATTVSWAVGDLAAGASVDGLTFQVTIDTPTFDSTVGLPAETIDNVGSVLAATVPATPSNEVKTPVTAVLGFKVVRKPVQKPAVLPFTGFGLPLGPTIWTALTLLGTGAILTSVRRRRKA